MGSYGITSIRTSQSRSMVIVAIGVALTCCPPVSGQTYVCGDITTNGTWGLSGPQVSINGMFVADRVPSMSKAQIKAQVW